MESNYLPVLNLFSEELNRELTIRQISELIKKSYAFTNKHVHDLIKKDILTKRSIGSAILCKLNFNNEETIGFLVLNSIQKKKAFKDKFLLNAFNNLSEELDNKIVVLYQNTFLVLSDAPVQNNPSQKFKFKSLSEKEFSDFVKRTNLGKIYSVNNHETYWRLVQRLS